MPTETQASFYNKANPFLATISKRERLSREGSHKNTHHIVLNIEGSGITYNVGDSVGVFPVNRSDLVELTLKALKFTGDEIVLEKNTQAPLSIREYLRDKANITTISRKLLKEIADRHANADKKQQLETLLGEENKEALKSFLGNHELWDLFEANQEASFQPQEIVELTMPLLPRLYSIASSQSVVGDEIHLTVALLHYHTREHLRKGVCTHFLCHLAPEAIPAVPIYIQTHHGFTVPEDPNAAMIMIGPGTGVAPFRAFMQERMKHHSTGANWLFFGEWTRRYDFFYEDYWEKLVSQGKLRLDLAFSRDQSEKIYVQHRMLEHSAELYKWIQQGAYIYVCGDAHRMAKDVEATLQLIIQEQGNMDEAAAKAFVRKLRTDKRYLRDVY